MYQIEQNDPGSEFRKAWELGIQHISRQAGNNINWLGAYHLPPVAAHYIFHVGKQLYLVRIELDGNSNGPFDLFLELARQANGIPCILKLRTEVPTFQVEHAGWGLIHADTFEPIHPPDHVTDELIEMSDWEIQDVAIQVVCEDIKELGIGEVFSRTSLPGIDPQVWFGREGKRYWVVVRPSRHSSAKAKRPENLEEIARSCAHQADGGYFASVNVVSENQSEDGEILPVYRGQPLEVEFEGLEEVL